MNRIMLNTFICNILHFNTDIIILNLEDGVIFTGKACEYATEENELYITEGDHAEIECVSVQNNKVIISL